MTDIFGLAVFVGLLESNYYLLCPCLKLFNVEINVMTLCPEIKDNILERLNETWSGCCEKL